MYSVTITKPVSRQPQRGGKPGTRTTLVVVVFAATGCAVPDVREALAVISVPTGALEGTRVLICMARWVPAAGRPAV